MQVKDCAMSLSGESCYVLITRSSVSNDNLSLGDYSGGAIWRARQGWFNDWAHIENPVSESYRRIYTSIACNYTGYLVYVGCRDSAFRSDNFGVTFTGATTGGDSYWWNANWASKQIAISGEGNIIVALPDTKIRTGITSLRVSHNYGGHFSTSSATDGGWQSVAMNYDGSFIVMATEKPNYLFYFTNKLLWYG